MLYVLLDHDDSVIGTLDWPDREPRLTIHLDEGGRDADYTLEDWDNDQAIYRILE